MNSSIIKNRDAIADKLCCEIIDRIENDMKFDGHIFVSTFKKSRLDRLESNVFDSSYRDDIFKMVERSLIKKRYIVSVTDDVVSRSQVVRYKARLSDVHCLVKLMWIMLGLGVLVSLAFLSSRLEVM
jgi:hypothetical protein